MAITLFPDGRIIHSNGVEVASEKMVDFWAINTDISSSDSDSDIPGSKFTRNDKNAGASQIGTGMSVDSNGIWTFPSTGKYMITLHLNNRAITNDNMYLIISTTTDNSTYVLTRYVQSSSSGSDSNGHSGSGEYFVNVTDTSLVKIKLQAESIASGSYFEAKGSNTYIQTTVTFTRLSS